MVIALHCKIIVLKNARVHTFESDLDADAIVYECPEDPGSAGGFSGKIIAVGKGDLLVAEYGRDAVQIEDLQARVVIPGLTDSHVHLSAWAQSLFSPRLDGLPSLAAVRVELMRFCARHSEISWLDGTGWNSNLWSEGRQPTRYDLDDLFPGLPISLKSKDWHTLWLNSEAMRRLHLNAETPDISGGVIERDPHGVPTGILRERAAFHFIERIPIPDESSREKALMLAEEKLFGWGITAVHSMETLEEFRSLERLHAKGAMRIRTSAYLPSGDLQRVIAQGVTCGAGDETLRVAGVKLFLDGSLGSQTAWLLQPYETSSSLGIRCFDQATLEEIVVSASNADFPCAVHAIGDAACRAALDAFAACARTGLRHRIEHAQLVHPSDVKRFAQLGIVASMQPSHKPADADLLRRHWGERETQAFPWAALHAAGATLCFGSDAPIESPDPFVALGAANDLSRKVALDAFTRNPAEVAGELSYRGTLAPGKRADFVILDTDPLSDRVHDLSEQKVFRTVLGGSVVYERD